MNQIDNDSIGPEEKNSSDINKKSTFIQQVILICLGSLTPIFLTTSAFTGVAPLFSMVLFSAAVAFSIAIKKPILLLIPGVVLLGFIAMSIAIEINGIRAICVLLVIIAALGIPAGFLFRLAWARRHDVKRFKTIVQVVSGVIIILISVLLIVLALVVIGVSKPFECFFLKGKIDAYVRENYPAYDLEVYYPSYHWKTGGYTSNVVSKKDKNVYFSIEYEEITKSFTDTFEHAVLSGWNTAYEWEQILANMLTPAFEKEFGDDFDRIVVIIDNSNGEIEHGQPFDKDFPISKTISIYLSVKDIEPATLAEEIIKCRTIVEQSDIRFAEYRFSFDTNIQRVYCDLKTEYINDELALLIKEMHENRDPYGSYSVDGALYQVYD